MAVRRTVLRVGAVVAGLAALGVALPTLASSERKCCDVRVREPAGTFTAGGEPVGVTATLAARRKGCTKVRPSITVSLAGLDPDEVRIERVVRGTLLSLPVRSAGAGAVRAADPVRDGLRLCGDGRANLAYRLTFLAGAPAGRATVSAEADGGGGKVLGRDATVTAVLNRAAPPPAGRPGRAAPDATVPDATVPDATVPGASSAPPAAGARAGGDGSAATEPATANGRSGTPAGLPSGLIATSLGAVVAATVALVAVLALRQRRRGGLDTGAGEPARSGPSHGQPRRGGQPTLAARWSSLVATVRRTTRPVSGGP